ncbi:hypothetical protein K466DRAFT_558117 [Polyporus arcularius HHB13444]|uniref:Fungal-type protein kinase domain-containing protein n=1 Tax=Polyporus arcularius HHB13444 TaxID=1314778 RepID=A0A5C3NWU3_9APHY|nr:hypothetical protein K466DRAFT_558117 [Polyporus arcularius HHB13444]
MKFNMAQVTLQSFLEQYLPGKDDPGKDIPSQHLRKLHYVSKLRSIKSEWKVNLHICKIGHAVSVAYGLDEEADPPIATRDVSNWSVNDKKHRANSGTSTNAENSAKSASNQAGEADPTEDPKTTTRVDVGVFLNDRRYDAYVVKDPDEFMKTSKMHKSNKIQRKDWVGNCSWADMVVPIEVKVDLSRSAFYFDDDPKKFLRTDSDEGREALGQIAEYVGQIFGHQHRKHLYAVYVHKNRARLLFFDRQGCVVSEPFNYGTRSDLTLHTFFWRIASMTREELGFDPTVVPAEKEDVQAMLKYAPNAPTDYIEQQIYHALSRDPDDLDSGPTSTQWPPYQLTMCGKRYIIGRPTFASPALYGRCTRGYLAYDIDDNVVRFIKESWRLDLKRMQPEHEVYERLKSKGVTDGVLTCLAYEDVPNSDGSWQLTRTHGTIHRSRPARGHYRILIVQVCRPLTDFADFKELAMLMVDALYAHRSAWVIARILHRDVSVSNIMIYEVGRGKVIRVGILCDWDLCKYAEQMSPDQQPRTPDRTGTWYYRSALSLQFPGKPYMLSDDVESFVHVYHCCVLRFHETDLTGGDLATHVESTYDAVRVRESDGAHIGGKHKLKQMLSSEPPMLAFNNLTLHQLLVDIAMLCSEHYSTIDIGLLRQTYDPTPKGPHDLEEKLESRTAKFAKRPRVESAPSKRSFVVRNGVAAKPLLHNHEALFDLFVRYTSGVPDAEGNVVRWPKTNTKCTDLFKGTRVAPRKNNNFSSSYPSNDYGYNQDGDERPTKRRKGSDGSSLPNLEESREEEEEEELSVRHDGQSDSGDSVEGAPPVGDVVPPDFGPHW